MATPGAAADEKERGCPVQHASQTGASGVQAEASCSDACPYGKEEVEGCFNTANMVSGLQCGTCVCVCVCVCVSLGLVLVRNPVP